MKWQRGGRTYDFGLLVLIFILMAAGLLLMHSASVYNGENKFSDGFYYLKKQGLATSLGVLALYGIARRNYRELRKYALIGYVLSVFLSLAVLFVGREYNGSKRWLALGPLSFQPSEFAKPALILFLADWIGRNLLRAQKLVGMLLLLISVLPIIGLVGAGNLSTAVILLGVTILLIFVASPDYARFFWLGGLGIGFLGVFLSLKSYRLERISIWRSPQQFEKGYQTLQGLYAIGSGGIFGLGFGKSIQKLGFVPEAQNDMIFSIICEEWGLVGAGILLFLFFLLIWRLYVIAVGTGELFGLLLVTGVMIHLMLQVALNAAVVTNTIPNTGITLPFVSYGGTSIVFLLAELGLALSVSKYG